MEIMVGKWVAYLTNICFNVAMVGALIVWVNLSAEEVRLAGRGHSAAKWIDGLNKNEAPKNTAGIAQALLIVAGIYSAGYDVLLKFLTSLSIVPYLLVSLYALKSVILGSRS